MGIMMRRRPLLRAAAVGGSAYLAGKKRGQRSGEQAQPEAGQGTAAPGGTGTASPASPASPAGGPVADQLQQITTLHQQGALTDAEFAAAKAKLLGT